MKIENDLFLQKYPGLSGLTMDDPLNIWQITQNYQKMIFKIVRLLFKKVVAITIYRLLFKKVVAITNFIKKKKV